MKRIQNHVVSGFDSVMSLKLKTKNRVIKNITVFMQIYQWQSCRGLLIWIQLLKIATKIKETLNLN